MNCSRTSAADFARVPGNGPDPVARIELVPLAIFQAAGNASIGQHDLEILDRVAAPKLQVDRLAAQQVPRSRHDVGRRHAAGLRAADARRAHVHGVEHAHIGLNRRGAVAAGGAADVAVRVRRCRASRVLPARSTVVAPAGIDTWPAAPTATIFPS